MYRLIWQHYKIRNTFALCDLQLAHSDMFINAMYEFLRECPTHCLKTGQHYRTRGCPILKSAPN